jgi:hypothetical protein
MTATQIRCHECREELIVTQDFRGFWVECECPEQRVNISEPMNESELTVPIAGNWSQVDDD